MRSNTKTAEWQEDLGQPDIQLAGVQVWIQGRQFENSQDYWDGNWLRVTAHRGAAGAGVWTTGPIIDVPAIQRPRPICQRSEIALAAAAG